MRWEDAIGPLKEGWNEDIDEDDGNYYEDIVNSVLKKKDLLLESASRFGTPQYILDEDVLREKASGFMQNFRNFIPNSRFFYAFKSNDLPYICGFLRDLGFNADVAGLFELQLALKLNFKRIIFTGPAKSTEELLLAIENRNRVVINVDNKDELDRVIGLVDDGRVRISVRVNPDSSVMKTWSKFGVDFDELKEVISRARTSSKVSLVGLHFHSSWNDTPERYCKNIKLIGEFLKEDLSQFEFLDIGGGIYPEDQATLTKFSHNYVLREVVSEVQEEHLDFDLSEFVVDDVDSLEVFGKEISSALEKYIFPFNKDMDIYLEPGRYVSNNSTHILLKVLCEKGENVIVDGGMNLIGSLDFSQYLFAPIVNLSNPSLELRKKTIYGSLCKADDLWGYSFFGEGCKKDDVVIVLMQGSYTFSRAWRFIKETAPYVVISNGKLRLAKEKEKFSDRYSGCKF